jgi:crotonobetainyl-CoA:carnitine CoA-transferase CaiB-like acyl-CoA transferase
MDSLFLVAPTRDFGNVLAGPSRGLTCWRTLVFFTNTARVEHRGECVAILSEVFKSKSVEHWVKLISDAGIPCGPINRVSDVVSNPQVLARNMVADIPHPNVQELRVPNSPLKLAATPPSVRRPPPLLGQHNEEILSELGYSLEDVTRLRSDGVTGS